MPDVRWLHKHMRKTLLAISFATTILACDRRQETPAPPLPTAPPSHSVAPKAPSPRPSPPSLPADCPSIERVGGGVTEPLEVSRVQPKYPDTKGHRFSSTLVILEAVIDRSGTVHDVHFLRAPEITPPLPSFNASIVDAISSWRYRPAMLNGRPVCVYLTVTVSIHLR